MLKIKANARDFNVRMQEIPIPGDTYKYITYIFGLDGENDLISIPTEEGLKGKAGDAVVFSRNNGPQISYYQQKNVLWTATGDTKNIYVVSDFPDILYYVVNYEEIEKKMSPLDNEKKKFLKVTLKSPHCYVKNRQGVLISHFFDDDSDITDVTKACDGDYVIYNADFLWRMAVDAQNKYDFVNSEPVNYLTEVYYYKEGEKQKIGALTPVKNGGSDDNLTLYLYELEGSEGVLEEYLENINSYLLYGRDERFFVKEEGIADTKLLDGTAVMLRIGDLRLELPVSSDFDTAVFQEEAMRQFIEEASESVVNGIVDYEKQQFVPIYGDNTSVSAHDVQKIVFKLRLRTRNNREEWKIREDMGWFTPYSRGQVGDSVYALGFDEDDIYYRKKKVSETFIRLLFYDTKERAKQKLLYEAKIFLNDSNLYGEYIEAIKDTGTTISKIANLLEFMDYDAGGNYMVSDLPLWNIETEFVCTNKYDYDNSTEGFYLHLFPSNLQSDGEGIIYMKVELNNAKYGTVTPFVLWGDGQKNSYIENGAVNMSKLYDDLYIPIKIRYNNGVYSWSVAKQGQKVALSISFIDGTLTLTLFEPKVN